MSIRCANSAGSSTGAVVVVVEVVVLEVEEVLEFVLVVVDRHRILACGRAGYFHGDIIVITRFDIESIESGLRGLRAGSADRGSCARKDQRKHDQRWHGERDDSSQVQASAFIIVLVASAH